MPSAAAVWRVPAARELLVVLAFCLFTALLTWPYVTRLRDAVVDPGDPYLVTRIMWWDYHQTFRDPLSLFHSNTFYPLRYTLAFSEHCWGLALPFFPLFALGLRPLTVHAVAMFFGFALSGYGAFRLGRTLTGSAGVGWVAGIAFAFVPFRFHLMSQLVYLFTPWLPLVFEALVLYARRRTWRRAAWLGAAFLMTGLTSVSFFAFALVPLGAAGALLATRHRLWRERVFWVRAGVSLGVAASRRRLLARPRPLGHRLLLLARLELLLLPHLLRPAAGLPRHEDAGARGDVRIPRARAARGPRRAPPRRSDSRKRPRVSARAVYAVACALLLLELNGAPLGFMRGEVFPDAVTLRLKETPMRGGVVILPAGSDFNHRYMLCAADHGKPLVVGTSGFNSPQEDLIENWTKAGNIPAGLLNMLEQIPASYVVIKNELIGPERRADYSTFLTRAVSSGRLRFVNRFDGRDDLYAVVKTEPDARAEASPPAELEIRDWTSLVEEDPVNILGQYAD